MWIDTMNTFSSGPPDGKHSIGGTAIHVTKTSNLIRGQNTQIQNWAEGSPCQHVRTSLCILGESVPAASCFLQSGGRGGGLLWMPPPASVLQNTASWILLHPHLTPLIMPISFILPCHAAPLNLTYCKAYLFLDPFFVILFLNLSLHPCHQFLLPLPGAS